MIIHAAFYLDHNLCLCLFVKEERTFLRYPENFDFALAVVFFFALAMLLLIHAQSVLLNIILKKN